MNQLLARQIRRFFGETPHFNSDMEKFLIAVEDAYAHYEEDRRRLLHSLELSSQELSEANEKLLKSAEQYREVLKKLISLVKKLRVEEIPDLSHHDILEVANYIEEQLVEKRRITEQLSFQEAKLRALIENTEDIIWSVDERLCLETFNRRFLSFPYLVGHITPKQSMKLEECWEPEYWLQFKKLFEDVLKGNTFAIDLNHTFEGAMRFYEAAFSPIKSGQNIVGVTVYCRDVTSRKRDELALIEAKEKAEEAIRIKSNFLAHVSHELRTPLNAIIGYSELITEELENDREHQTQVEELENITHAGKELLGQIDMVLDFTRLDTGKEYFNVAPVDLPSFSKEMEKIAAPIMQVKNNHFKVDLSKTAGSLETDELKLSQMIQSLLKNAGNFTVDGEVVLSIWGDEEKVYFSVRDTGIGIAADQQEQIFEFFYQAEAESHHSASGLGIGLAVTSFICKALGGEISFSSTVGKGSEFCISLPRYFTEQVNRVKE